MSPALPLRAMPQAAPAWSARFARLTTSARLGLAIFLLTAAFTPESQAADATIAGMTYRPLTDIAKLYDMKTSWETPGKTMQLQNEYCTITGTLSERFIRINNEPVALGYPIVQKQGVFYLAKSDFDSQLFPLLSPAQIPGAVPSLHKIVIDPGHGGNDPGTEVFPGGKTPPAGSNVKAIDNEKTHTLEVAMLLAAELRKRGYEVLLTRTTDINVDKPERTVMANKANADLYISIHFNQADQDYVNGTETWLLPPKGQPSSDMQPAATDKRELPGNKFDAWNVIAGFSMEKAVTKALGTVNRGVKRKHLIVLDGLNMPGLLIECGFLSNPAERAKIDTADFRQKIAVAIADGVDLYKATLDRVRPKPLAPPTPPAATASKAAGTGAAGTGTAKK